MGIPTPATPPGLTSEKAAVYIDPSTILVEKASLCHDSRFIDC